MVLYRLHFGSIDWKVQAMDRIPVFFSDHLLLRMMLEVEEQEIPDRGQWKLNVRLLEDEQVCRWHRSHYEERRAMRGLYTRRIRWWEDVKESMQALFFQNGGKRKAWEKWKRL